MYLGRYPFLSAENHYFSEKLLSTYLQRVAGPVIVLVEDQPYTKARAYLTYTGRMGELSEDERQQFADPSNGHYSLGNVQISTKCLPFQEYPGVTFALEAAMFEQCQVAELLATDSASLPENWSVRKGIASPIDSGTYYYVLNDPVCGLDDLSPYVHVTDVGLLDTASLSDADFCKNWMMVMDK